ncbi:MAG: PTS sugar transporter subunit IIA [Granulosicoccaceae bacterium]
MIDLPELIAPERVICRCEAKSKKRAIQTVAELMALSINDEELSEMDIMDALVGREKIGSTAIGHGVALPHARIPDLDHAVATLITLEKGVDFEASDEQDVDLIVGLLVPQECNTEHLEILAGIAKRFSQEDFRDTVRTFKQAEDLFGYIQSLEMQPTIPADQSAEASKE